MKEQINNKDNTPVYDRLGTGGRSRYEVIKDAVDKVDCNADQVNMLITVLDYDYPYDLHFDVSLKTAPGYAHFDVDEFLDYINNLRNVEVRSQTVNIGK